ncbi:type VI secretion system Vgr family protein [Burkholderia sp. Ax-1719]|uniref:type VI secretion system Vgr family protein n=1 Tax=Burkholderia sp. Ax-1719 TaxID=2608334 RepID=UPI00142177CA|nr:type VI secretion system Vgr family protein [Burkholderia sp. Ax-1719]NIE68006.1 type VI secretion system tip protein VgrG [Burkholderia sp. Ax-1719]
MAVQDPLSRLLTGRQAYFLEVSGTDSASQISVVAFKATERLGEPNVVRIELTHPQQLSRAEYLNREGTFRIVAEDATTKQFSGYIERFSTVQTTKDYTKYEVVLKSRFGRLQAGTNTQVFQHLTIPQIVQKILRAHGIRDHQMLFRLRGNYPKVLWRFQYQMTDFDYVHMLMEKTGIYCYIVETEHGDQIVFGDDIDHYIYDPRLIVPYREAAGLESGGLEAVTTLKTHMEIVPQSYRVADYNPDSAWERFRDEANVAPSDSTTYGQPYIYGTGHLDQQGAKWEAQLRHEAALARQVIYEGESNVIALQCARVIETDIVLPDAPKAQVVIEITHRGARDKAYSNTYKAIPADRRFRLQLEPSKWAKIAGSLSARICSPDKYTYSYLNAAGYYVVRLDADFGPWPKGGESVPLRLAKPFAGKLQTGMHFVALDNDEATITFRDGDPDKPEISGFHHHSQARDLVTSDRRWLSRNMIRTQSNNKLRMEDWEGQEGVKLSTEHSGKSQLNLGYLVNQKLEYRGEGYELRTSGYGVERAGKGLHLTTYDWPSATGKQLDMQETIAHLESALATAKALAASASSAKAEPADTDAQQQMKDDLDGLKKPGLLMSTPASAALVAGQSVQLAAQGDISAVAGRNADWSVLKRFTVAAGERVSLFAQRLGIKVFAAKGPVEIQAQTDAMSLTADQDLSISTVNGTARIVAKKELVLECGGAFIQLKDSSITLGGPADLFFKVITIQKKGKATLNMPLDLTHPSLSGLPTIPLTLNAAASPSARATMPVGMPYKLFAGGTLVKQGVFDESGLLQIDHHPTTQKYALQLANGVTHEVPVAEVYRGNVANGTLANDGFHFHESTSGDVDRAEHRATYNKLLNPDTDV